MSDQLVPAHEQQSTAASPSLQDLLAKATAPAVESEAAPEPEIEVPEPVEVEAAPEPEKPRRDPTAARFGALAKKEKELRNQMSSFDSRMKEFEVREQALRDREIRVQQARRPLDKLKEFGFTHADVTQDLLNNWKEPELDPLDEKLKPHKEKWDQFESKSEKLAKEIEDLKAQLTLKDQKETYAKVMTDLKATVADEKYELTQTMGQEGLDLVQEVIMEYFNENEILLDFSRACDIVEEYYEKQLMAKLIDTKKAKSRLAPPEAPKATPKQSIAPKAPSVPKTLTQAHTSGSQATIDVDKMTKEEAIAYFTKKLQFKQD